LYAPGGYVIFQEFVTVIRGVLDAKPMEKPDVVNMEQNVVDLNYGFITRLNWHFQSGTVADITFALAKQGQLKH
jgi:hypothetical protein